MTDDFPEQKIDYKELSKFLFWTIQSMHHTYGAGSRSLSDNRIHSISFISRYHLDYREQQSIGTILVNDMQLSELINKMDDDFKFLHKRR